MDTILCASRPRQPSWVSVPRRKRKKQEAADLGPRLAVVLAADIQPAVAFVRESPRDNSSGAFEAQDCLMHQLVDTKSPKNNV